MAKVRFVPQRSEVRRLDSLQPWAENPRGAQDLEKGLSKFAQGIEEVGLIHPWAIEKSGLIIDGNRRYTTVTEILGWPGSTKIYCHVYQDGNRDAIAAALHGGLRQRIWPPYQRAQHWVEVLMNGKGMTIEEVSRTTSVKLPDVRAHIEAYGAINRYEHSPRKFSHFRKAAASKINLEAVDKLLRTGQLTHCNDVHRLRLILDAFPKPWTIRGKPSVRQMWERAYKKLSKETEPDSDG